MTRTELRLNYAKIYFKIKVGNIGRMTPYYYRKIMTFDYTALFSNQNI